MDYLTPEESKRVLTQIMRLVECPVCLYPVRPPELVQCGSGHILCAPCRTRLDVCPVCRSPFTLAWPVVLCHLLESLPRFCDHRGCNRRLEEGHRVSWCEWSPTRCKFLVDGVCCDATVPCRDLLRHVKERHGEEPITEKNIFRVDNTDSKTKTIKRSLKNLIHDTNGFLFWAMYSLDVKELEVTFVVLPNGRSTPEEKITGYVGTVGIDGNVGVFRFKTLDFPTDSDASTVTLTLPRNEIKCLTNERQVLQTFANIKRGKFMDDLGGARGDDLY